MENKVKLACSKDETIVHGHRTAGVGREPLKNQGIKIVVHLYEFKTSGCPYTNQTMDGI
jgi:hypothetical protein